jgi:hypothetical protein
MPDSLPTKEAVLSLMELTERTPEAAEYFYNRMKIVLNGQLPEVSEAMRTFSENVEKQGTLNSNPMAGDVVLTLSEVREVMEAPITPEVIPADAKQIDLDIQIDERSRMERRYTVNNQPVESELGGYLDGLIMRWIAKSKLVRVDHIMYPVSEKKDEFGKSIPISSEELKEKLEDPTKGVVSFIDKVSFGKCGVSTLKVDIIPTPVVPSPE